MSFHPSGSPGSPQEILVTKSASGLTLQWTEGDSGEKPTTGYIIEARPSGKPWETWTAWCFEFPSFGPRWNPSFSGGIVCRPSKLLGFCERKPSPPNTKPLLIYYVVYQIVSCLGIVTENYPKSSSFHCATSLVNHPTDEPIELIIKTHLNAYSISHAQGPLNTCKLCFEDHR